MADEKSDNQTEETKQEQPKRRKKKLLMIVAGAVLVLISGLVAYMVFSSGKEGNAEEKKEKKSEKAVLISVDPLVLNLAEPGRFLKVTMQFELFHASYQQMVIDKIPQMKDAIIILICSKSHESISSPEGKLQLKDELLLRANQSVGMDVFKNLYFTEFVMQ
ncbi:MAG: flagellar basal body-associated FliL family protein [Nitrospirota bacterium]